jgi:SAM-dependent methyltransferase
MDEEVIHDHWLSWATSHGTDLRATTRSKTAKRLELDALRRHIAPLLAARSDARILEMGCGNGINCLELARCFADVRVDGVDFVAEMIGAAERNRLAEGVGDRVRFFVGDAIGVGAVAGLADRYDIVFTDRCIINLNSAEAQGEAIGALAGKVAPDGHLLMIENSTDTFAAQNDARVALGLEPREPAAFNRFISTAEMTSHIAAAGFELLATEDFSSLHDLLVYAILPAINGGAVDYDHPVATAAAELSMALSAKQVGLGQFGQNRLYVCGRARR